MIEQFKASVTVHLDEEMVLLATGELYSNGQVHMGLKLRTDAPPEMLGALLLAVATDLIPDELQVKAIGMIATLIERANHDDSPPF